MVNCSVRSIAVIIFLLLTIGGCQSETGRPLPAGTILVLGDSLSAGYNLPPEKAWPALMRETLLHEGYSYQLVNASISGDTTAGGLARLPELLERNAPVLVMIELGANDGLRGQPLLQMKNNLAAVIAAVQAQGAEVMLLGMQLPPNFGPGYTRDFAKIYFDLAEQYHTALMPFLLEPIATSYDHFLEDGLHPNAAGQQLVATAVFGSLQNAFDLGSDRAVQE
ncbi:MAG: arylesterase [Gammaproteobacteria bacterium]|nr:arylesterase [Gammaproteobacteria bacterium]